MFSLSSTFSIFFQGSAKSYGGDFIKDDNYMTLIGTIGSILRIFAFIWSILMEKFNFKTAYAIALCVLLINSIVSPILIELKGE